MPADLSYYLIWYVLSRLALVYALHRRMKNSAARTGGRDILSNEDGCLFVLGFIPLLAECGCVAVTGSVILSVAIDVTLRAIYDFYGHRYGGRRG